MRVIKLKSKGAIRVVAVTDTKRLNKYLEDGFEPILNKDGTPYVFDFKGQTGENASISQKTIELNELLSKIK